MGYGAISLPKFSLSQSQPSVKRRLRPAALLQLYDPPLAFRLRLKFNGHDTIVWDLHQVAIARQRLCSDLPFEACGFSWLFAEGAARPATALAPPAF